MKRVALWGTAALVITAAVACSDAVSVGGQLLGTWALAAFDDHGTVGETTGTWTFSDDGTFAALGTVTYPGEPTDSLRVVGTWRENSASAVELTVGADVTIWSVTLSTDTALLSLTDAEGTVRITLVKPGAGS